MRQLSILKKAPSASLRELQVYEEECGIGFPLEYRNFLLQLNPIEVRERVTTRGDRQFHMDRFFPFDESNELSLQSTNENLRAFFENKYLTFGCDSGGWQYVISVQEKDYGKVYFCRLDMELPGALTLLADSFDDFINELQISDQPG